MKLLKAGKDRLKTSPRDNFINKTPLLTWKLRDWFIADQLPTYLATYRPRRGLFDFWGRLFFSLHKIEMDDREPLLPFTNPKLKEDGESSDHLLPSELKDRIIFGRPHINHHHHPSSSSSSPHHHKSNLHRSRTAPAIAVIKDVMMQSSAPKPPDSSSSGSIVQQAFVLLLLYLLLGILIYSFNRDMFLGTQTHPLVDALYFCVVTMCTIGYGDITPSTTATKLFSILFVLVGFGFIDILLAGMVGYVLDLQETHLLRSMKSSRTTPGHKEDDSYIVDVKKGRMRIRMKVALALGVVVLCIGIGVLVLHCLEDLDWLDSFYLSVMSVTTVGYGDRAFKTMPGRIFASIWLLVSTLAVARAFLYLAEARVDKRHRKMAKWVLAHDMSVSDFLAADIDNNGFVSKSEYAIYKLKEMGKVTEKDVTEICKTFDRLDTGNCGKISLVELMENGSSHHG